MPLLVAELLESMADGRGGRAPLPPSLAILVERRLAALTPAHARTVQVAAVLWDVSDWTALQAVATRDERVVLDALRAARSVQLLVVDDAGGLQWRHALTRDAVLGTLLPPERAAIAARGADVLLDRGRPGDAARAADLLERAARPAQAAEALLALARRDIARGALRSAMQRLDRAAVLVPGASHVLIERVRLLTLTGRAAEALEIAGNAVDGFASDDHARLRLQLARAAITAGRWADAEEHVRRADRPDDPRSLVLAADAAFGDHRPNESAALAARAVQLAERGDDPAVLCEALVVVARAALTDLDVTTAALTRAARVATEHGRWPRSRADEHAHGCFGSDLGGAAQAPRRRGGRLVPSGAARRAAGPVVPRLRR
jgi:tetratricopeptide (TPR) repeat protein